MLVSYIYDLSFQQIKYGVASAVAMVLFVIVLLITVVQFRAEKKWENIIFKGFSDEERRELFNGMEKMAENSLETCKNQCKESENFEKG